MTADKRKTMAERAADRIAELSGAAAQVDHSPPAMTPPEEQAGRPAATRGVLGRLQGALGPKARIENLEIDPRRVRVWALQGRLQDALTPANVADLLLTMSGEEGRQHHPAIVRPISDDPNFSHEVIDGSRRRLACELTGRKLWVLSGPMTDHQAALVAETSDTSVRHSPYEVGMRWHGWIENGIATNAAALAEMIGASKGDVSRKLNLALVPRAFLRCWGEHDRVPKPVYLRLASLIATAKQTGKLSTVQSGLEEEAATIMQSGQGAAAALRAIGEIEGTVRKRAASSPKRGIERLDVDARRVVTVTPGKQEVSVKLGRVLPEARQTVFADAIADFVVRWLAETKS
jgi:ParB/RepB/Spo0J family partition protein